MVALLGPGDEHLALIEKAFKADVHVRGNQITLRGEPAEVALVERLLDELVTIIRTGQGVTTETVERAIGMLRTETTERPGRRAEPEHPVQPRPDDPAQDAEPEALRRRDRQAHDRVRHRARRHRQDLPRDGQGRAGAAVQEGQPDHPDPAGRRGGGAARLPARHAQREDRPLPAAAVRRAARHARPGDDPQAARGRHDRGRPAGLHARAHPQRRVHHPRRGAEHLARADEDVPDPARASAPRSSSPATSPRSTCPAGTKSGLRIVEDILDGVEDVSFNRLTVARRRPPPAGRPHRRGLRRVRRAQAERRHRRRRADRDRDRDGPQQRHP